MTQDFADWLHAAGYAAGVVVCLTIAIVIATIKSGPTVRSWWAWIGGVFGALVVLWVVARAALWLAGGNGPMPA